MLNVKHANKPQPTAKQVPHVHNFFLVQDSFLPDSKSIKILVRDHMLSSAADNDWFLGRCQQ
jgi:hypothetical protein